MAADEQRHELITDMAVARAAAILIALLQQHREHRVPPPVARPARQQLKQQPVEPLDRDPEPAPRAARPEVTLDQRHGQHPRQRADAAQRPLDRAAQLRDLGLVARPEHDAQDHL